MIPSLALTPPVRHLLLLVSAIYFFGVFQWVDQMAQIVEGTAFRLKMDIIYIKTRSGDYHDLTYKIKTRAKRQSAAKKHVWYDG